MYLFFIKNEIIIDNYANKELLDTLRDFDKKIIIMSKNVEFVNINPFHDRYIIYNSETSLKDIGKSYSYINRENESIFIYVLLKRINNIL